MSYSRYLSEKAQYRPGSQGDSSSSPNNPFRDPSSFTEAQQHYVPPAGPPPAYGQLTDRPASTQFTPDVKSSRSQLGMSMGYANDGGPGQNSNGYSASAPYKESAQDRNRSFSERSAFSRSPQPPPEQYLAPNYPPYRSESQSPLSYGTPGHSSHNNYPPQSSQQYSQGSSSSANAGQSSASPSFLDRMKGPSSSSLLDPPPPSFSRPASNNLPYSPFPPCALISVNSALDKGFPFMPPPSPLQPHPFILHDVGEDDWTRFVHDIKAASALTPMDRIGANVAPMVLGVGFVGGLLLTSGIEKGMKGKKHIQAADIVDHWNHYFFHPRCMEVTLAQGDVVYAGADGAPPDMPSLGNRGYISGRDGYSSSSSDSSDDRRSGRRDRRRDRKMEKRDRKRERRGAKRDKKGVKNQSWRLIVSYRPPML